MKTWEKGLELGPQTLLETGRSFQVALGSSPAAELSRTAGEAPVAHSCVAVPSEPPEGDISASRESPARPRSLRPWSGRGAPSA